MEIAYSTGHRTALYKDACYWPESISSPTLHSWYSYARNIVISIQNRIKA